MLVDFKLWNLEGCFFPPVELTEASLENAGVCDLHPLLGCLTNYYRKPLEEMCDPGCSPNAELLSCKKELDYLML